MTPAPPRDPWVRQWASQPLNRALGILGDDVGEGYVRFRIEPAADGAVDGLAITTAADLCVVAAAGTVADPQREEMNGTAEMNLTYAAPPRGAVTVSGRVLHHASHLAIVELEALDQDGALVAKGRGSYALRPRRGAK